LISGLRLATKPPREREQWRNWWSASSPRKSTRASRHCKTRCRQSNRLEHFVRTCGFGAKFVKSVADDDIEDWMEKRAREVSASAAAKDLISVRHLFKRCITDQARARNSALIGGI
jgi:site-specific recombinase XerD